MGNTFFFSWEPQLIMAIQAVCGPLVNKAAEILSMLGEEMTLVALLGFMYWCWDKQLAKRMGVTLIAGLISGSMIKNLLIRRRPYFDHSGIRCIRAPHPDEDPFNLMIQDYSFPSLHSSMTMTMFYPVAWSAKKKPVKAFFFLLPVLVGISRVILGVHYPTDVIGGWLLGLLLFILIDRIILPKTDNYLLIGSIIAILGLPGWFFSHTNEFFTIYGLLIGMTFGFWFEKKYVNFENTRNPLLMIVRVACGMAIFLGVTSLLKLPFPSAFLETDAFLPHLIRCLRYACGLFTVMAIYPMVFRKKA